MQKIILNRSHKNPPASDRNPIGHHPSFLTSSLSTSYRTNIKRPSRETRFPSSDSLPPGRTWHPFLPQTPSLNLLSEKQLLTERPSHLKERFPSSASLRPGPIPSPSPLKLPPLLTLDTFLHTTSSVDSESHSASRHPPASHPVQSGTHPSPEPLPYFTFIPIQRSTTFMLKHFTALPVIRQPSIRCDLARSPPSDSLLLSLSFCLRLSIQRPAHLESASRHPPPCL